MLLFIETSEMDYGYTHLFQYISCCYLSFFNLQRLVDKGVSIHLMLLFIFFWSGIFIEFFMFQYISCCYLSDSVRQRKDQGWKFQYISCCYLSFHRLNENGNYVMFQYISCCYLSFSGTDVIMRKNMFQYISCCYLSVLAFFRFHQFPVSIHLMLLFILPALQLLLYVCLVSIHLMLLFIFPHLGVLL